MLSKQDFFQEIFGVKTYKEAKALSWENFQSTNSVADASSWVATQFPYEAPSHPPLPPLDEIKQKRMEVRGQAFRLGAFMIKASRDAAILQEAEDLLFLRANSQVRVPTLYAAFTEPIGEWTVHFMVMEYIEGEPMSPEKYLSLSAKARSTILKRLSEQLQLLRSIPSEGYYGRVHRQGWRPNRCYLQKYQTGMSGPFSTYEEFVAALTASAILNRALTCPCDTFFGFETAHLERMESTLLAFNSGRRPVFTHLDPHGRNTIIRPFVGPDGEEDWEVTLIDWADSGWFPAWMQAVAYDQSTMMTTSMTESNDNEREEILGHIMESFGEDYTTQIAFFQAIMLDLGYAFL